MNRFNSIFNGKKILITGHTGFKGSWLSAFLSQLGAKVIGLSDRVPTNPAHYNLLKDNLDSDLRIDVNDAKSFFKKPESNVRIAVGRSGNVIGDEDWAAMDTLRDKQYLEKLWNESTTPRKGW